MKITKIIFLLLLLASGSTGIIRAQKCQSYFPSTRGATLEYAVDDIKNSNKAVIRQTVSDVADTENGLKITVRSERVDINDRVDQKGQYTLSGEMEMRCEGGVFYADVRSLLDSKTAKIFKGGDVKISGVDLLIPSRMSQGQSLPDAEVTVGAKISNLPVPPITIYVVNRKVKAVESITTSAGTFDCYKITYEIEVVSAVLSRTSVVEWIAKDIGVVQSETYDGQGTLLSKMWLTKFEE